MRRSSFILAILLIFVMAIGTVGAQTAASINALTAAETAIMQGTNFQAKIGVLQAYLDKGDQASDLQTNENAAIAALSIYTQLVDEAKAKTKNSATIGQGRTELNILAGNIGPNGLQLTIPANINRREAIVNLQADARSSIAALPTEDCRKHDLVPGWDVQSGLAAGCFVELCQRDRWEVTFEIHGTLPNHEYTTGIAFFDLNPSADSPCTVSYFDGQSTASGCWSRDGQRLCASYLNFAKFTTDGNGDGKVTLSQLAPAKGSYKAQFYLRDGGNYGSQDGGPVAYHTGAKYGDGIVINVQ